MKIKQKIILFLSLLFLAFALYFASFIVGYTNRLYAGIPMSSDILFNFLPFINLSVLADILPIIGPLLFILFVFKKKKTGKMPYYAVTIGIFYLIRSFFIYFVPMANPYPLEKWGLNIFPVGGMFPSGHVGVLFLMFLLIKEEKHSRLWTLLFFVLAILEAVFMVLSRGHYTIDVVGAVIIAYALNIFGKKNLKRKLMI